MKNICVVDYDSVLAFTSERFENDEVFSKPIWLNETERENPDGIIKAFFSFSPLRDTRRTIHQFKLLVVQDDEITSNGLERITFMQFLMELELFIEATYLRHTKESPIEPPTSTEQ